MLDIGEWLRGPGLQSYEQAFRDNGVDIDVLPTAGRAQPTRSA
jgi:hypothetical protein